jgi:hypothetical protein
MSKTSHGAAATSERELTDVADLDAVSGGFGSQEHTTITPAAPASNWRKLLVDPFSLKQAGAG